MVCRGMVGVVPVWIGRHGEASLGRVGCGTERSSRRGSSWIGVAVTGMEGCGRAGLDRPVMVWIGNVRIGKAGMAGLGLAERGMYR